jgi:integrase
MLDGKKLTSQRYYVIWDPIMKRIGADHTPHECRHTLRSRLDSAGANKRCIDLIMGHKSKDVGERVYTHKTIQELKDAIELVTY